MTTKKSKTSGTENFYYSTTKPHNRIVFDDFKSLQVAFHTSAIIKNNFIQFLSTQDQKNWFIRYFNEGKSISE